MLSTQLVESDCSNLNEHVCALPDVEVEEKEDVEEEVWAEQEGSRMVMGSGSEVSAVYPQLQVAPAGRPELNQLGSENTCPEMVVTDQICTGTSLKLNEIWKVSEPVLVNTTSYWDAVSPLWGQLVTNDWEIEIEQEDPPEEAVLDVELEVVELEELDDIEDVDEEEVLIEEEVVTEEEVVKGPVEVQSWKFRTEGLGVAISKTASFPVFCEKVPFGYT